MTVPTMLSICSEDLIRVRRSEDIGSHVFSVVLGPMIDYAQVHYERILAVIHLQQHVARK